MAEVEAPQKTAKAAPESSSPADGRAINQIVGFRLADEEYGVDIMRVQEIILLGEITKIPEVPDFICGLINLRGHVIPIVDLRKRFDLPVRDNTEHTRIIVVNVKNKTIGMVVDAVNEVLRINAEQIEPPPSSIAGIDHAYIRGLVKFDDKLLILLNIEQILTAEEQERAASAGGNQS
ncbi:MAG: purine-binding chemotaxis protein CheW [Phycisphaerales bacterium]|nr:purine-binding chemotaxis protein CheW [Phycisphaerales bacterium]